MFLRLHHLWNEVPDPRAWLFRAIRNLGLNHLRDHRRETPMEDHPEPPAGNGDPVTDVPRCEAVGMLQLLMAELPDEYRSI